MDPTRNTKIVATLGPASSDPETLRKLVETGVNVFRLNFSHGNHEDHAARVRLIRTIEAELGQPIAILADMQGPKIRIGEMAEGIVTGQGDAFCLVTRFLCLGPTV